MDGGFVSAEAPATALRGVRGEEVKEIRRGKVGRLERNKFEASAAGGGFEEGQKGKSYVSAKGKEQGRDSFGRRRAK